MRSCRQCGTAVPWGAPQCVECGSYTHWRDRLAIFGIVIGVGTVLVVLASLARVWLAPPPEPVQAAAEVQELLRRIADSEMRGLVAGAGRCKPQVAHALCVQTTPALAALDAVEQERARAGIAGLWKSIAEAAPPQVVFVDPTGRLDEGEPGMR